MKFFLALVTSLVILGVSCRSQTQPTQDIPKVEQVPSQIPSTQSQPSTKSTEPTETPYPTPAPFPINLYFANPKLISDPDLAIDFSHNLLILRGYEGGFSYDAALYGPIEFPDGSNGAFVALGYSGPTRGYKLVYRIHEDGFELVQAWQDNYDWGINWGYSPEIEDGKISLVMPNLLINKDGKTIPLIQISGVWHPGVGQFDDGHFEILQATADGVHIIFSGSKREFLVTYMGFDNSYSYLYKDLDGDGNKEIIKLGRECGMVLNQAQTDWNRGNCRTIHEIYKYNGDTYVKQP